MTREYSVVRYKVEGELKASPETVFSFIDPSPTSSRSQWDKAIKELQLIEKISEVGQATRHQVQSHDSDAGFRVEEISSVIKVSNFMLTATGISS